MAAADWKAGPALGVADRILSKHGADPGAPPLAAARGVIERCFSADSIDAIVERLRGEADPWADKALGMLEKASPSSLKLTFRQLQKGSDMGFDEAMIMEYRLSQACTAGDDLYEGVRAVVVEKDQAPVWRPASLAEVSDAAIEQAFAPLGARDLTFD